MGYGNFRGGSSGGSRGFGGGNRGGGFRRSFGPREMTKIKCAECGKEDEVPFKPRDGSTVLCKECYFKKKGIEPRKPFNSENKENKETSEEAENFEEEQTAEADLGEEEKL